jgi:hypothetical protein
MAMLNKLVPGSCWKNPIWYRGWRIYRTEDHAPVPCDWGYAHDSYDGSDEDDARSGYANTVEEAKAEIDQYEADIEEGARNAH